MHFLQNWACDDFDLCEFIGLDNDNYEHSPYGTTSATEPLNAQDDDLEKMYSTLQYNNLLVGSENHQNNMYGGMNRASNGMMGSDDMGVNGFIQDDRYHNNSASSTSGGLLNTTVNKLYQQQQQNQPSTSRLTNVAGQQQQQQNYSNTPSRMRPQIASQIGQIPQQQMANGDLADSVLLPTSSTSPQNMAGSLYLPQQTAVVKAEPPANYEMVRDNEYLINSLRQRNRDLEAMLSQVHKNCKCGAAQLATQTFQR
jgi:hypothetical protein